ncbi:CDP-alcohol phosphatidyltransferase family protein [Dongia deserti]|uniref:CDP-alcohol phosphatidyltransferase family protein n=1 Tax=Dongia deserti TaxID=2268030 RepID=UPI000E649BAA|nr:CDP-alcohol phosphatidyltransferase family protein [Dongia deserti]
MLDRAARRLIDPVLDELALAAHQRGLTANQITVVGFACGLATIGAIALQSYELALLLLLANRLADGIDGALARRVGATDLGGYLDIVLDFIIYSGTAFAFALAQPDRALAAAFLIFSFMGTGSSFLAFAIFAAKRKLDGEAATNKSFYYLGGITEGTETILFFVIILLFPGWFPVAAYIYGTLCWLTTIGRIGAAVQRLR